MRTLTEERRQAIIAAASQVFQEIGYERASMNEVAKRAGGSKATLYNYFPSKEALFETVVRQYSSRFLADAAADLISAENINLPLAERLTRFGEKMLQVLTCDNQALQIYRVVLGEAGHSDIGLRFRESGVRQSMDVLTGVMAEAIKNGELRDTDPALAAMQFTALAKAETEKLLYLREIPHYSTAQISDMVRRAVQVFLYGMMPGAANG